MFWPTTVLAVSLKLTVAVVPPLLQAAVLLNTPQALAEPLAGVVSVRLLPLSQVTLVQALYLMNLYCTAVDTGRFTVPAFAVPLAGSAMALHGSHAPSAATLPTT